MLTVSTIIDTTITLYKTHLRAYMPYSVIVNIIPICISLITIATSIYTFEITNISQILEAQPAYIFALILIGLASLLLSTYASVALMRILNKTLNNEQISTFATEFGAVRPIFLTALCVSILIPLITIGGLLLLIIPGIIFSLWFTFAPLAAALDNKEVGSSFSYSKSLVSGRWFRVLWLIIAPSLVFGILGMIVSGIIGIPSMVAPNNVPTTIITGLLDIAITIILTPLYSLPYIILYQDLKKNPVAPTTPAQM